MKKTIFPTVVCLLCAACAEEEKFSFPCTFTGGELVPKYETRVYTDGGRRIEGHEAQAFLDRCMELNGAFPGDPQPEDPDFGRFREPESWIGSFRFDDAHTLNPLDGSNPLELRRRGDVILAGREDRVYKSAPDFLRYDPEDVETSSQSTVGWVPSAVIRGGYLSPHFSMVSLKVVRWRGQNRSFYLATSYNEFDRSVLETLTEDDTLAVREYYVRFRR